MIRLVSSHRREAYLDACRQEPLFGPQLQADLEVLGTDHHAAFFWEVTAPDGSPSGAVCRRGGRLTVAPLPGLDSQELGAFVRHLGDYHELYAPAWALSALAPGTNITTAPAMTYPGGLALLPPGNIDPSPPLLEAYKLLHKADPASTSGARSARDFWYTYTSHLTRHGLGCMAALSQHGRMVSVGGVCGHNGPVCTLGNIATLPEHRGRGYAGQIVRYLVNWALERGMRPNLLCREESLAQYYETLGFVVDGRWGKIIPGDFYEPISH